MKKPLFENVGGNQFRLIKEEGDWSEAEKIKAAEFAQRYKNPLDDLKSLGCANGWRGNTPEEVKKCKSLGHQEQRLWVSSNGNTSIYGCKECGYKYTVDSS